MILILSSTVPKAEDKLCFIMFTVFFGDFLPIACFQNELFAHTSAVTSRPSLSLLVRKFTHPATQPQNNYHILHELFQNILQIEFGHLTVFPLPLFS